MSVAASKSSDQCALRDIEPVGAGRIRHVGGIFAGHAAAHIVLGQQNLRDLVEDRGLMLLHPDELGRGEARQRDVAGDLAGPGLARLDLPAFGEGARVVPQDGRAQHLARLVEQRRAMLLAGKADAFDRGNRLGLCLAQRS